MTVTAPTVCLLTAVFYGTSGMPLVGAVFTAITKKAYFTVDGVMISAGAISATTDDTGTALLYLAETETAEERLLFQLTNAAGTFTQDLGWGLVPNADTADFGEVVLYPFQQGPQS